MAGTKAGDETRPGGGTEPRGGFLGWFLYSSLSAAVFGVLLLGGLAWAFHQLTSSPPPSASTVTSLMTREATAGKTRDTALVERIYSPDAVVADAACGQPAQSHAWEGYGQLDARYSTMSKFLWLEHIFAQVTWEPDNSSASTATATAETAGVQLTSDGKPESISGRELWTFAVVDGQWRITSFTYNMCVPPDIGG
jgi:hypothetical protein